ncbi:MAG TPA: hypothetical protein VMI54_22990 [Polyangiaceae bacterium]|nr:hypothetical protein [Polyangiaceae bacterium]
MIGVDGRERARFVGSGCAVFAAALFATSPLAAQYRHRVVLLETAGDAASGEVQARLRGELAGAGFEVVTLPLAPGDDAALRADTAAGELHPAAVLYVIAPEPDAPDAPRTLFISDRLLHKNFVVRFRGDAEAPANQAAQVAVQAVEILNADLAELSVTREAPPPLAPSAPPVREAPPRPDAFERRRPHAELQGGFGVLEGFRGTGATWTPIVRGGVNAPESWFDGTPVALSLLASVAAFGGEVTAARPAGAARMTQAEGDLELVAGFAPHAAFEPFLLVKSGVYTLRAQGTDGAVVRAGRTWSGTSGAGAGVRAAAARGFALVLSAELSFAWSRSVVRIAEQSVASGGSPAALYGATAVGVF